MRCRCPHCHNPIEILSGDPLSDIDCPSCGIQFHLLTDRSTATYHEKKRRIAHFELLQKVGEGRFGIVWKARDTELDRIVAVKIPRAGELDEIDAEQFFREARAAAQVKHPHIVTVHEIGREQQTVYIVSDFVDGANLREYQSGRALSFREATELCVRPSRMRYTRHTRLASSIAT